MAFNINDFITRSVPLDGFRPNLFDIYMVSKHPSLNFEFKAKATTIPESAVGVASTYYYGRRVKLAGNRDFASWTITVIMDENDFEGTTGTRGTFESWLANINYHQGNYRNSGYVPPNTGGYFGTAQIVPMKKDNSGMITTYQMNYCFPTSISPINLDWQDNDRIAEFQVTFEYQWWTSTSAPLTAI